MDNKSADKKSTVLIVDDNIQNLRVLGQFMEDSGYNTVLADSGSLVFDYLETEKPDIILLDIMMPETDGYEVIARLKKNEEYAAIPVIFITAKNEPDDIIKGFELGAVDYVCKPFNTVELRARVKTHLKMKEYSDTLVNLNKDLSKANENLFTSNRIINSKNSELKRLLAELEAVSKTDFLTGLYNRRYMMERINVEMARSKRTEKTFAIMIADVDHFKNVNDTYGHDCGDEVLKNISETFQKTVREVDSLARWGGEEFLMLVVEITPDDALSLGERIRWNIEHTPIYYRDRKIEITITVGITIFDLEKDTVHDVILRADNALYMGKRNGRNRVVMMDLEE